MNKKINKTLSSEPSKIEGQITEMNDFIKTGIEELISSTKEDKKSRRQKKKTLFDKYKLPVKKKKSPIKSNLTLINPRLKYGRFLGGDDGAYGPTGAAGMSSFVGTDATPGGGASAGWGVGGWGVTGFGEAINNKKSGFIHYMNGMYEKFDVESADILSGVVKGYKILFDNIEKKTTCVLMGMQPSLSDYFINQIDEFVQALNNYLGEIVSVYVGESNGMETKEDIINWYREIGINDDVVNRIAFVEKSTAPHPESLIDLPFDGESGNIDSIDDVYDMSSLFTNAVLVGCFDMYFAFDFMLSLSKLNRSYEIDKRFAFLLDE